MDICVLLRQDCVATDLEVLGAGGEGRKNPALWFFLGFIPLVGFFLTFILASRPDAALLDRIRRLEEQVASSAANTARVEPPPI